MKAICILSAIASVCCEPTDNPARRAWASRQELADIAARQVPNHNSNLTPTVTEMLVATMRVESSQGDIPVSAEHILIACPSDQLDCFADNASVDMVPGSMPTTPSSTSASWTRTTAESRTMFVCPTDQANCFNGHGPTRTITTAKSSETVRYAKYIMVCPSGDPDCNEDSAGEGKGRTNTRATTTENTSQKATPTASVLICPLEHPDCGEGSGGVDSGPTSTPSLTRTHPRLTGPQSQLGPVASVSSPLPMKHRPQSAAAFICPFDKPNCYLDTTGTTTDPTNPAPGTSTGNGQPLQSPSSSQLSDKTMVADNDSPALSTKPSQLSLPGRLFKGPLPSPEGLTRITSSLEPTDVGPLSRHPAIPGSADSRQASHTSPSFRSTDAWETSRTSSSPSSTAVRHSSSTSLESDSTEMSQDPLTSSSPVSTEAQHASNPQQTGGVAGRSYGSARMVAAVAGLLAVA
ncbi:hypothetical protein XA68_14175 [Ophiocordyceps unilateralis]|uniref:Uncharacterized protein n=1 Tax=Ophiocordyceps unilateralis TaxID=268505 RepID=A0A2A9PLE6_OPHUN|nr:hypothetical protein XA68_14175 [Ophiocordyceps unilateralis]